MLRSPAAKMEDSTEALPQFLLLLRGPKFPLIKYGIAIAGNQSRAYKSAPTSNVTHACA